MGGAAWGPGPVYGTLKRYSACMVRDETHALTCTHMHKYIYRTLF